MTVVRNLVGHPDAPILAYRLGSRPYQDSNGVAVQQMILLNMAEQLFGARDRSYPLLHHAFESTGPFIRVHEAPRSASVSLSLNAAEYWPAAIFEMAHEVIHLLNPVQGCTNHLEEGIAVAFQLYITPLRAGQIIGISSPTYQEACRLVSELDPSNSPFDVGARIRRSFGAFSRVTAEQLALLFPDSSLELREHLVSECRPR